MTTKFSADEVFEMADEMEEEGAEFYRKAAQNAPTEEAQRLLLELAEWEEDHKRTFRDMRKRISGGDSPGLDYDPDGEAGQYLRAFVEGRVFSLQRDASDELQEAENLPDILRIAIGLEKDSIMFYLGIKDVVPSDREKLKMDKIISEERKHVVTLTRMIDAAE